MPTDPLADWMTAARPHGAVVAYSALPPRWGVSLGARPGRAAFHSLLRGDAWLSVDGGPPVHLPQGTLVLLPRAPAHALTSHPDVVPVPLGSAGAPPRDGPLPTRLLCGEYSGSRSPETSVWRGLPEVVHLAAADVAADPRLVAVLELLAAELGEPAHGAEPLTGHLLDALMVYVLRAWARTRACGGGWLAGLGDPALAPALRRIHEAPERAWTVDELARAAGVSRAVFARRFAERMGEPPMEYLRRWRMTLAAGLLADADPSLAEVASRVGYTSEFAFNRAFKRVLGQPPGQWRRSRARAGGPLSAPAPAPATPA